MLVGNKTDLADKRSVSIEQGQAKAAEYGALFIESSAKTDFNIKPLFQQIASALPPVDTLPIVTKTHVVFAENPNPTPPNSGCTSC